MIALALLLFAPPAQAQEQAFRVVVVPGLALADLERLEDDAAVGMLVPAAGPETSERQARASLAHGKVRNSLRGGLPQGPDLLRIEEDAVPPREGPVIVLALPEGGEQRNDRRYPIAVIAPGYEGVLVSDSTRIPGLVSIVDVAPTALGRKGGLDSRPEADAARKVAELDTRIAENNGSKLPASLLVGVLIVAVALARPAAGALAFAAALAVNLALGALAITSPWIVLAAFALSILVCAPFVSSNRLLLGTIRARLRVAVGAVGVAVIGAYLAAMAFDPTWVALSPLGPTQNSRFYGISNLLETMFLVPALVGAAILGRRFGAPAFLAVSALALVTVAGNRFGADGGGAIVLAVGFAVLGALLARASRRTIALAVGGALALVVALFALDAATGASSHVTRSLAGGPGGVASDLAARVPLSSGRATSPWYVARSVVVAVAARVVLVVRHLRNGAPLPRRSLLLASAAAVATSLVVNDSPLDVALFGVIGYAALDRFTSAEDLATAERGADDGPRPLAHR